MCETMECKEQTYFYVSLLAGAVAGFSVDVSLFPLDTVKTRLQSEQGFWKLGGFRGIYAGIGPAALGSAPNAALFFCTYDYMKSSLGCNYPALSHMIAAAFGEVAACTVRVPVEVIKQRRQISHNLTSMTILRNTLLSEGLFGLYRGYVTTVIREVPFSLIQFPLWEWLKVYWSLKSGQLIKPWQAALCGAFAGGFAAACTTPIDVAKTRIMLANRDSNIAKGQLWPVLSQVYSEKGIKGLFAGTIPRVLWISIGGAIFLGMYEKVKDISSHQQK